MRTVSLRATLCMLSLAVLSATTFDTVHARTGRGLPSEGDLKTESSNQTQDKESQRQARRIVDEALARFKNNNHSCNDLESSLRNYPVDAVPAIIDAMDTNDETIQVPMANFLVRLTGYEDFYYSNQSVKTIIGLLKSSPKREVKSALVGVLGNIGPRNAEIKEALIYTLKNSPEPAVKRATLDALAHLAQQEKPALAADTTKTLIAELSNQDSQLIRQSALYALSRFKANPEVVVPALLKTLDDNYAIVRNASCQALGAYQSSSREAIPKLIEMIKTESDSSIKYSAMSALHSIDRKDPRILQLYLDLLDDPVLGRNAMSYLSNFGPDAAPATPKLIELLKSGDVHTKHQACQVLAQIGPAARSALPALTEALKDPDPTLVRYAEQAITRLNQTN